MSSSVFLIASGDLRLSANQMCWPAQKAAEDALIRAIQNLGPHVERAHPFVPEKGHGFIDSQRYGLEIFEKIPATAPVIIVEAVWQYSHHVLGGLIHHRGPILTVANWSGQWPGLVGMLNLNACLAKAGVPYDTLWSTDFSDAQFLKYLETWLNGARIEHDASHVKPLQSVAVPPNAKRIGRAVAQEILRKKSHSWRV